MPEGTRILIVEDIITTGGSVDELITVARNHRAEIIGVVNLVDRNKEPRDFGVPSRALLQIPADSWSADECPLCKDSISLTAHGRSGKK